MAKPNIIMKVLSPKVAVKAMQTFDRATMIVVGASWAAAILMTVFAIYTVSLTVSAKRSAEAALIAEPILPTIVREPVSPHVIQTIADRLQKRYPEITFSIRGNQGLTISAIDGTKFHQWLTALGYVDTIAPEFHWSLQELCVGKCGGAELMRAVLGGEKISFQAPETDSKK